MPTLQEKINNYLFQKLEITLSGKTENLCIIDWNSIVKKHEEVMEQMEEMDDEEAGEFLCDNETELIQITENFMNDACDEKVEDDKWLPFGLLGLTPNPKSFAEKGHSGLLLFDMTKGNTDNPPVILFKNGKAQTILASFEELAVLLDK
jgi:hypothetical protein